MSKPDQYDVIVIGAGHNGLTTAGYLSRAGYKVKVVESRHVVGGAAVTEEICTGYRNSLCSYTVSLLNPKIIEDLELAKYGLEIHSRDYTYTVISTKGEHYHVNDDVDLCLEHIRKLCPQDADKFKPFWHQVEELAAVLREVVLESPPNIGGNLADLYRAGKFANLMRKLSPRLQREMIKIFTLSVADYLKQWFEGELMLGGQSYISVVGNMQSVYAPGSAYVLLHHYFGEVNGVKGAWGHAKGGMGSITQAMARSAEAYGCDIEVNAPVKKVIVESGVAKGVILQDGREIKARVVASNTNPKLLFQKLVDNYDLEEDFSKQIDRYRSVSGTFRMNVALDELPQFSCLQNQQHDYERYLKGSLLISDSLAYNDKAYYDAMRKGWSEQPIIEMFIPSVYDDTLAPEGKHVMSLFCQHFNPELPDGKTWDDVKDEVVDLIIDTVNKLAPNFRDSIVGKVALSPLDLERDFGLIGGDIFHGCLHLDQVFSMRPVAGYANYRMPIKGLYLCGSGAHPGGGVSGCPGYNAAREIKKDLRWRKVG